MSSDYGCGLTHKFLGLGFWIQGFRCFPWMAVLFFLKDDLNVDPHTLQILQNFYGLPVVAKPLYGIVSDSIYIRGQRRIPYISIGVFLQAVSWLAIASLPNGGMSIFRVSCCLILGNFGAAIVEVANDAIVMEMCKQPNSSSPSSDELLSYVWMASSIGGILGNLAGVLCIDQFSPHAIFLSFAVLLLLQFSATLLLTDTSLNLPNSPNIGVMNQLSDMINTLKKSDIFFPILWFLASFGIIPMMTGTMFFYQTHHLRTGASVLGISKLFGQVALLMWSIMYNRNLKFISQRKLVVIVQAVMALLMLSDVLFVKRIYLHFGIPDPVYIIVFSGVSEVIFFFKILPFSMVMAKVCPIGCEGSLMAILMSVVAGGLILGGYFGVVLASFVGLTGDDYGGFPLALVVQAAFTIAPLYCSSWIPEGEKSKRE